MESPPVRLYLDDVEEMIGVLSKLDAESTLEIKIGRWRIDDVSELRSLAQGSVKNLDLAVRWAGSPALSAVDVHLYHGGGWVKAGDGDDLASRGAADTIHSILRYRRDWFVTLSRWPGMVAGAVLGSAAYTQSLLENWRGRTALGIGIIGLLLLVNSFVHLSRTTTVLVRYRADREPWLKRNSDDLVKIGVAALLGWLLGRAG